VFSVVNPKTRPALPPLSLYVHIPWCVRKCPYCDFSSIPLRGQLPETDYVAAVVADLDAMLPLVWGRRIESVFFGGGTPSLVSPGGIEALLSAVCARLALAPGAEITLEANPGTVDAGRFADFRAAGVDRLSLGIQSFDGRHLKSLGRIHDADDARRAAALAARHFANFNLDLMYGLPEQTPGDALTDIEQALAFAPPHLSCYQLAVEPGTPFAAAPPALPGHDLCADMQEAIEARLADAGLENYETSAFVRRGARCRHNLNYWTFGDYLGLGAGAHGKLTFFAENGWTVRRQARARDPARYMAQAAAGRPAEEDFTVEAAELPFEFMMNALRLTDGFDAALFEARTAQPLAAIEPPLRRAEAEALLTRRANRIQPTQRGRRFLNRLLEMFLA
jgi:oxygen-independent coproporphyrinogen-3 oxidase